MSQLENNIPRLFEITMVGLPLSDAHILAFFKLFKGITRFVSFTEMPSLSPVSYKTVLEVLGPLSLYDLTIQTSQHSKWHDGNDVKVEFMSIPFDSWKRVARRIHLGCLLSADRSTSHATSEIAMEGVTKGVQDMSIS